MPELHVKDKYQSSEIAEKYDGRRFESVAGRNRNRLKIAAINKALSRIGDPGLLLDLPYGTGRFFDFLSGRGIRFVGSDVSFEMLRYAATKDTAGYAPLVVADVNALPFADDSFDTVMSIRFLFHLSPAERVRAIRELARICKGRLILDYRLRFASLKNISRIVRHRLGLAAPLKRPTKKEMLAELAEAGLDPVEIFTVTPVFSDKFIVVCRKRG